MTFYALFWYFCIYALLGWGLEVCFCTLHTGHFVNRGFLNGPVCPIYGFGMVIILAVLEPLQNNLFVLFLGAVLLTSTLELITGIALKKLFHTSWWDYTDQPLNLGGYICLKFSLGWGVCAVLAVRVLHPLVAGLVSLLPPVLGWVLLVILAAVFCADATVTVLAIAKLNKDLGRITLLTQKLHEGSELLAQGLGDGALAVDEKLGGAKQELGLRLDLAKAEWADSKHAVHARLLKAFPRMKHESAEALQALRAWYNTK